MKITEQRSTESKRNGWLLKKKAEARNEAFRSSFRLRESKPKVLMITVRYLFVNRPIEISLKILFASFF